MISFPARHMSRSQLTSIAALLIFATHPAVRTMLARDELAPWSVLWLLERRRDAG